MRTPCEMVERHFLSELRAVVSKKLWELGYRQRDIGELLGVTQPVVSEIIHSGRSPGLFSGEVDRLADDLVRRLGSNWDPRMTIELICQFCKKMKLAGAFCSPHMRALPSLGKACNVCMWTESGYATPDVFRSINDSKDALRLLESESQKVIVLYPQVGINIARIAREGSERVIGIPGRVVKYHGRLRAFSSPEVGGSFHNGTVLMEARKAGSSGEAVVNTRFIDEMNSALLELGWNRHTINRRNGLPVETRENELLEEVDRAFSQNPNIEVLIDPGAFGIEPTAYFFGDGALQAVKRVIRVSAMVLEGGLA